MPHTIAELLQWLRDETLADIEAELRASTGYTAEADDFVGYVLTQIAAVRESRE